MKRIIISLSMLIFFLSTGCTSVPARYSKSPHLNPNGGYLVEGEDSKGFYLEVFYKSYSFLPEPDDNIQEAKDFFVRVAQDIALKKKRAIKPIITSQLKTNANRNILDGHYSIYVSGRVDYIE